MTGTVTAAVGFAAPPLAATGVEATGGSPLVVLAGFVLLVVASILSILVTYKFARGYRRSGARPLLALAVGLFLLAAAPTFARLAFANVVAASAATRTLVTSGAELLGLLIILHTIYR